MQHIHQINGAGRLFGDRRLRPHCHQLNHHQSLKCPRCDSLNTKFCYYNNYNLSQPRHFCKNCRRYWTNGGILRNVPVGGGCRKSKRSSKPKATAKRSTPPPCTSAVNGDGGSDAILLSGDLMSVMNNDNNHDNYQLYDISVDRSSTNTASFSEFCESGGVLDQTVTIEDLLENRGVYGGVATLDWQNPTAENEEQGLIDFSATVDHHEAYWSQQTTTVEDYSHWSHSINAHPLFLP